MNAQTLCLAWSRVLSPLVGDDERRAAWDLLGLEGDFASLQPEFFSTFHVAFPSPSVPLVVHAALGRDGGVVREDLVRVMEWLAVSPGEHRLAPDHLACVLELVAVALEEDEPVLVDGLCERYVLPWCAAGREKLAEGAMRALVERLRDDLSASD